MFNDIRFGVRMLVKRPGLSALAIIALALGIGFTTTMWRAPVDERSLSE